MNVFISSSVLFIFFAIFFFLPFDFGFGGDVYGLHLDYYKLAHNLYSFSFGNALDGGLKSVAYILADDFSQFLKLLQIKGFAINFIICVFIGLEILNRQSIVSQKKFDAQMLLFIILISMHPYFLSTLLMGHTSFYAALPVLLALKSRSLIKQFSSTIFLILINPYLLTTFIFVLATDLWLNASTTKKNLKPFLYFIAFSLIALIIFKINADIIWTISPGRENMASGALPFHLFIPPPFTFAGFVPVEIINRITIYSNVPEMFLFVGWGALLIIPCLISRDTRQKALKLMLICLVFYIMMIFPPKTDHFGTRIYFPSFINSLIFEQLRMISRNASGMGLALSIFPFMMLVNKQNFKRISFTTFLFICCIFSFPSDLPHLKNLGGIQKSKVQITQVSESCGAGVEWTHYYAFFKMTKDNQVINCSDPAFREYEKKFSALNNGKLSNEQVLIW